MRILFLNLTANNHLAERSQQALKRKFSDGITHIVELNALAQKFVTDSIQPADIAAIQLPFNINEFDQIIIGAHGLIDDTHYCYSQEFVDAQPVRLLDVHQLALFTSYLLRVSGYRKPTLNIILAICFAARSQQFDRHHIDDAGSIDLTTSFSHEFTRILHEVTNQRFSLHMIAPIGELSFYNLSGEIIVTTEEQSLARLRLVNIIEPQMREAEETRARLLEAYQTQFNPTDLDMLVSRWEQQLCEEEGEVARVCHHLANLSNEWLHLRSVIEEPGEANYGLVVYNSHQAHAGITYDTALLRPVTEQLANDEPAAAAAEQQGQQQQQNVQQELGSELGPAQEDVETCCRCCKIC